MANQPPAAFARVRDEALKLARTIPGQPSDDEVGLLALVACCPTADGVILELGSYLGRSTIILAKAASAAGVATIVAVDPLTCPSSTDPDIQGRATIRDDFFANLLRHGVTQQVEFHQSLSHEVAQGWNRPIRFLWHDASHTYEDVNQDLRDFLPHLVDRGILAMHDVLHRYQGPLRAFMENVLLSDDFGPCGLCDSIGWAQKTSDRDVAQQWRPHKLALYRTLSRLVPMVAFEQRPVTSWQRRRWRWIEGRINKRAPDPAAWSQLVGGQWAFDESVRY